MRIVSDKQLTRMKKQGGVKVKRKLGTGTKKPESDVKDDKALSGAVASETALLTPASLPAPDLQSMASMAASMAVRDAQLESVVVNNTRAIEKFRKDLQKPEKKSIWENADFVRHKVVRDNKSQLIDYVDSIPMEN